MCNVEDKSNNLTFNGRRGFLKTAGLATIGAALSSPTLAAYSPKPENVISANAALDRLMEGNMRYVKGDSTLHNFNAEREALVGGQNPYACILSCSDSRITPEYAFDSARGDLFVVRVAGNFVSMNGLASLEYAVKYLGTRLLMVLGHQGCGAISGAISAIREGTVLPGRLPELIESIAPSVGLAINQPGDLLENAVRENVRLNVAALRAASPILSEMVATEELRVVGGVYNLESGQVDLLG
ncbi:MAG: carbonic anhydrase [Gammaproteobacteria bacterium]|nr:carbonic anhydrase [Gammaproteobacteria bacterium]MCP4088709.1 carbonic anhydrase [Gammaproteobacteria bacterium]MCP4275248.1 carbonic anhydrase [Gammaproteobacteria bacterium]MCP4831210.1 carbonic anhydrase [Gammaproteobacteria bacterium]MCP4929531.1 carbonic anhydrase [Gammaproteobacteria bacterium]